MGMISIRLTDEEERVFKSFADSKELNLSDLVRKAITEKIEDEYDLKAYNEYLENKEYQSARPLSDLIKEVGLEDELQSKDH